MPEAISLIQIMYSKNRLTDANILRPYFEVISNVISFMSLL